MSIETMTKLSSYTVGVGGISAIDFINIPQEYTDLKIVISGRTDESSDRSVPYVYFNSDTSATTNYSYRRLYGIASIATSSDNGAGVIGGYISGATATAGVFGNLEFYIPNYSQYMQKSITSDGVSETNASPAGIAITASLWNQVAPITSIKIYAGLNTSIKFVQHSTATLYGVKNARATAGNSIKATGGSISFDGTYVYHTFNNSGSFIPTAGLTIDYLVVAGGGGGANGGGGAGGFRTSAGTSGANSASESKLSLFANTPYTVTIGAGGAPVAWANSGNDGNNSAFSTISSLGGGGGGGPNAAGRNGGSGGGAGNIAAGGAPAAGNGTANQGLGGGGAVSNGNNQSGGGGGGGASVAGASFGSGGAGGAGLASTISGRSIVYAGGGGAANIAGAGGSGGGGAGGSGTNGAGINGTANTGGGGGGSIFGTHGAGGSGVVIIRYLAQ
jgi:hypothetical protein